MSLPFDNSHFYTTSCTFPNTPPEEWRPLSKNIKVHFRIWNCNTEHTEGPIQILIFNHGFLGNSTNFRKLYTPLQQNKNIFAMIALDCPGFGYSDRGIHILHHDRERFVGISIYCCFFQYYIIEQMCCGKQSCML